MKRGVSGRLSRDVFQRYLKRRSVRLLKEDLIGDGIVSKVRVFKKGNRLADNLSGAARSMNCSARFSFGNDQAPSVESSARTCGSAGRGALGNRCR